jgi:hypothetical protein
MNAVRFGHRRRSDRSERFERRISGNAGEGERHRGDARQAPEGVCLRVHCLIVVRALAPSNADELGRQCLADRRRYLLAFARAEPESRVMTQPP